MYWNGEAGDLPGLARSAVGLRILLDIYICGFAGIRNWQRRDEDVKDFVEFHS